MNCLQTPAVHEFYKFFCTKINFALSSIFHEHFEVPLFLQRKNDAFTSLQLHHKVCMSTGDLWSERTLNPHSYSTIGKRVAVPIENTSLPSLLGKEAPSSFLSSQAMQSLTTCWVGQLLVKDLIILLFFLVYNFVKDGNYVQRSYGNLTGILLLDRKG